MTTILSPTRGGEPSYQNQDKVIAIAKERDAKLIFLYVSDVQFDHELTEDTLTNVSAELEDLGQFLLSMAQERAALEGIQADALVKSGNFREVLESAIQDNQVDMLILGSPEQESAVTTSVFLKDLSTNLAHKYSLEVILLRAGDVLETFSPS